MTDTCGCGHVYGHQGDRTWARKSQLHQSSCMVQREQTSAPKVKGTLPLAVLFRGSGSRFLQSTLEFDLRLQEYIELARLRQTDEAIGYLKRHIINWHDAHMQQIKQATALLAFPPDTTCNPYKVRRA